MPGLRRLSTRVKLVIGLVALLGCAAVVLTVPLPTPAELRSWVAMAGWAAPALLLLAYSVFAAAPIPRTLFNLASGLLLGNALGIVVAMVGTTLAGLLAFGLARVLGRDFVLRHLQRDSLRRVHERLADGGTLAVASLRLIPVIPFAPLSYCCGVLAVRTGPYTVGTILGSLPGTLAVVVLGDALTGTTPPALLACYGALALLGALGLVKVLRGAGRRTARERV